VSLAQATSTRLGEASRRNRGGFSGVFAQARATRLGENTRFPICSRMHLPRIHGKLNQAIKHAFQTSI